MYRDSFYPFYMNYQDPRFWEEERMQERENQLMRSFYPKTARKIQEKVEEECDRMDYPGSFLYDEYPDKFMMEQMCRRVRESIESEMELEMEPGIEAELEAEDSRDRGGRRDRDGKRDRDDRRDRGRRRDHGKGGLLDELVHVLLFQEMKKRRCRGNRCRRFF